MFKEEVAKLIASAVSKGEGEIEKVLEIPPDASMGDFAFPCFILSKDLKKPPHLIAKDLVSQIKRTDSIEKIEAKGPYVNFFVSKQILAKEILQKIHKEGLEYGKIKHGAETVVIEFPAPNTNKPLHLGHIRNLLLGESVSRILEFVGSKVVRVDLINDRGVHIC
ncbi:MAG: arginine--tRNA ligase, partial [Nanoarchaeota archaeon]|nr:arginine--tRNA ligase [Nanoarchaeota archaeon]